MALHRPLTVVLLLSVLLSQSAARPRAKKARRAAADDDAGSGGSSAGGARGSRSASPAPTHNALAMGHHQRGTMAHVQGDLKGAVAAFRQAIAAQPDFAYAYFRLGFVQHEMQQRRRERKQQQQQQGQQPQLREPQRNQQRRDGERPPPVPAREPAVGGDDDPLPALRTAMALDPKDEMTRYTLGQVLQDGERLEEAASVFEAITTSLNPRSAQAYWALGKVRSRSVDEWDSDPDDPADPSHCYETAARLRPEEFQPDGGRVRRVEPRTPELEAREEADARDRRQQLLQQMQEGTRTLSYAEAAEPPPRRRGRGRGQQRKEEEGGGGGPKLKDET